MFVTLTLLCPDQEDVDDWEESHLPSQPLQLSMGVEEMAGKGCIVPPKSSDNTFDSKPHCNLSIKPKFNFSSKNDLSLLGTSDQTINELPSHTHFNVPDDHKNIALKFSCYNDEKGPQISLTASALASHRELPSTTTSKMTTNTSTKTMACTSSPKKSPVFKKSHLNLKQSLQITANNNLNDKFDSQDNSLNSSTLQSMLNISSPSPSLNTTSSGRLTVDQICKHPVLRVRHRYIIKFLLVFL